MRTITNLINPEKHIYVLFNNQALCRQFLAQAEWEGFTIGNKKPTEIEWTDALAVQPDKKLCHLGFASRMALHLCKEAWICLSAPITTIFYDFQNSSKSANIEKKQ